MGAETRRSRVYMDGSRTSFNEAAPRWARKLSGVHSITVGIGGLQ